MDGGHGQSVELAQALPASELVGLCPQLELWWVMTGFHPGEQL